MVIPLMYKVQACGSSDIGQRPNNEDYWALVPEDHLFVVADGMGGHQAGEIASCEAVKMLCKSMKDQVDSPLVSKDLSEVKDLLIEVFHRLNSSIFSLSCQNDDWKGMGTTLCCLFINEQGVICAHVGDSRIYRLRQGILSQLTQDHSLLRELMDLGQIDEEQADSFLYRNILTRAVGTEPIIDPTIAISDVLNGDVYLLCTDGLTDLVAKEDIENILNDTQNIHEAVKKLIKLAKENGGYDNITVILVKVQNKDEAPDLSR